MKRAITLGGGGPAAGLHIGVLDRLNEAGIKFDVWALSCIGAWVGIVYNQCEEGQEVEQTYDFFRDGVFRDDISYRGFPINAVFGPDWADNVRAATEFVLNPASYQHLFLPDKIAESLRQTSAFLSDPSNWNRGDFNQWVLNNVMAVNPSMRFLTSLMYLSGVNGLSKIYYPDSNFLKKIDFEKLRQAGKPCIIHNAYNITTDTLELFCNQKIPGRKYKPITAASLCACSALPFIEGTVEIDGATYCEGALVDTVNFRNLLEDHFDLDEIWISRIVDAHQIRKPENLHDALANLCQLFAATVGEDDIKLFKYRAREGIKVDGEFKKWAGTVVEIHVDPHINFQWTHHNLKEGRDRGYRAADHAYKAYLQECASYADTDEREKPAVAEVRFINEREKTHPNRRRLQQ